MMAYDIRNITLEQLRQLIANGDDRYDSQIRVSHDGMVYLSQDAVGAECIDDVAFRFETFCANNGFVGAAAAEVDSHVKPIFNALKGNWNNGCKKRYIDDFKDPTYGNFC